MWSSNTLASSRWICRWTSKFQARRQSHNTKKREKYKAQAVEYAEVREFRGPSKQSKKTKDPAIRFICIADAQEDPNSPGYCMKLSQWRQLKLACKHSKAVLGEDGEEVEVSDTPILKLKPPSQTYSDLVCVLCSLSSCLSRNVCRRACVSSSTASFLGRFSTAQARPPLRERLSYYAAHTHTHTHTQMRQGGRRDSGHW